MLLVLFKMTNLDKIGLEDITVLPPSGMSAVYQRQTC